MSEPYVDTDVLIRLLTGDDPRKQEAAARLFETVEAGALTLRAPDTIIADAVFVLASTKWYALPRPQVAALLTGLVRLPNFQVDNKRVVLDALAIYASTRLDFGDAMIVAAMQHDGARSSSTPTIVDSIESQVFAGQSRRRREPARS